MEQWYHGLVYQRASYTRTAVADACLLQRYAAGEARIEVVGQSQPTIRT